MPCIHEYPRQRKGIGVARVADAVRKFAPASFEWDTFERSEFCFIQGVSAFDFSAIQLCLEAGKKVFLIQHCHQTAPYGWQELYGGCKLVASYQDLTVFTPRKFNFLHTPYGYDPDKFRQLERPRQFRIFTTGHIARTECIDKVWEACQRTNFDLYHTGKDFRWTTHYRHLAYMEDAALCEWLNQVDYVTCLREIEGFELLGVEALACGARPIVPNLACYDWYDGYGYRVDVAGGVVQQLSEILLSEPRKVHSEEQAEIARMFAWPNIVAKMFRQLLE